MNQIITQALHCVTQAILSKWYLHVPPGQYGLKKNRQIVFVQKSCQR